MVDIKDIAIQKDTFSVFLFQKGERIATALYLVTDILDEKEPLKWHLRTKGINLVKYSSQGDIGAVSSILSELHALLSVASRSSVISEVTTSVIKEEVTSLIGHIKDKYGDMESLMILPKGQNTPESIKDNKGHLKDNVLEKTSKKARRTSSTTTEVSERKEKIMTILELGEAGVKDIASRVENVSEKTLQRDLSSLVDEGVVERSGERRWAKYSLAK